MKHYINKKLENKFIIPVYHVANERDNKKFCKNPWLQYSKRDGYWLGAGMYFWINYGSALFWYHLNKNRYNNDNGPMTIAKATLDIPDYMLLDLTDGYDINRFDKDFRALYNFSLRNGNIDSQTNRRINKSGGKINWFYYTYQKRIRQIPFEAVRITGDYSNIKKYGSDKIFRTQERYNGAHITDKAKIIYVAKLPSIIINRKIIKVL